MAFNSAQFKAKKKRVIDPDAPPRPNLLSHEKKMKESALEFAQLAKVVLQQQEAINSLKAKLHRIELVLDNHASTLRGRRGE